MDKHEALLSLEKAHKLRKHADKLEKQAYEILDEKKEHEVKASAHVEPSVAAHAHSRISALHNELAKAAPAKSQLRSKHAAAAVKHLTKSGRIMDKIGVPVGKQTAIHIRHQAAAQKYGGSQPNVSGAIRAINKLKEGLRH